MNSRHHAVLNEDGRFTQQVGFKGLTFVNIMRDSLFITFCLITMSLAVTGNGSARDNGLFPIIQNGKEGYINVEGKIVVEPSYNYAGEFSENKAIVKKNNLYYIISQQGKLIAPIVSDHDVPILGSRPFHAGVALIKLSNDAGAFFVDEHGKPVFEKIFEDASSFSNQRAAVKINGKWGYIDNSGYLVIKSTFDLARSFSGGIAHVRLGSKWGIIDRQGDFLVNPRFDFAVEHSNGLSLVAESEKLKLVDKYGNQIIDLTGWEGFDVFKQGLAHAIKDGKSGFVNMQCQWVIEPRFSAAYRFTEGCAGVKVNGKWGFINKRGAFVIKPQFDNVGPFQDGLARIWVHDEVGNLFGYINREGQVVWPPSR